MNNNIKYVVMLLILLIFSISCAYATNDTDISDSDSNVVDHSTEISKTVTKANNIDKPVKTGNNLINSYNSIATEANEEYVGSVYLEKKTFKVVNPITINKKGSTKNVVIYGNGAVIDGSNSKSFLHIAAGNKVTINDLVIKNTKETPEAGGISISDGATVILNNCNFTNDVSTGKGGAIVNRGKLTINNCVFTSNTADQGGAIWSTGEYGGSLTIKNSKFISNKASNTNNYDKTGVIYVVSDKNVNIEGNTFEKNNGRSIHLFKTTAVISGNTFKNTVLNAPSATIRGAVIDNYEANFKIINNVFNNINISAKNVKGGLLYNEIGTSTFEDNTITNFKVSSTEKTDSLNGGILFNRNSSLTVWDNKFNNVNNGYKVHGGALYNNIGTLKVYSNTFNSKNTASNEISGGAIYNDKTGNVKSILNHAGNIFSGIQNKGKVINKIFHNLGTLKEIALPKKTTKITLNKVTGAFGDNVVISATVKNSGGKAVTIGNVVLKINAKKVTLKTNKNGVFSYTYKTSIVGKNNVTASYTSNIKYAASSTKTTFTVTKRVTKLTVNKVAQKAYNDQVTVTGKLVDKSGKIIKNAAVKIKVNTKTVTVKTNDNGVYTYKFNATKVGKNNVTVSYATTTNYKASSVKTTFTITKKATKLTFTNVTNKKLGSTVTLTGKLTASSGAVIKNANIRIRVNNVVTVVKTDSNGVYKHKVTADKVGTNNVIVYYPATTNYKGVNIERTFEVTGS